MSKIVVLVGSPRRAGNTALLAQAFAEGAAARHQVELLSVTDYRVAPCTGCNACYKRPEHTCCQRDDMDLIYEKLREADILVIASPVYFYGISAQLKTIVDRLHTPMRSSFRIRKLALLLVGGAQLPELFDAVKLQYQLVLNFFRLEDGGMVLVPGARAPGDVKQTDGLQQAYALGHSI